MEFNITKWDKRRHVTIDFEINDSVFTIITKVSPIDILIIKFEVLANTKSRILDPWVGEFTY